MADRERSHSQKSIKIGVKGRHGQNNHVVSQISGLDKSHNIPTNAPGNKPMQRVMVDGWRARRWRILFGAILAGAIGLALAMWKHKPTRDYVFNNVDRSISKMQRVTEQAARSLPGGSRSKAPRTKAPPPTIRERASTTGSSDLNSNDCRVVSSVSRAVLKRVTLPVDQRIRAANCFLLNGSPVDAEFTLKFLRRKVTRLSDRSLNSAKNSQLAEAFHLLIDTAIDLGKPQEASELLRNRCKRWRRDHACVAKLHLLTEQNFTGNAERGFKQTVIGESALSGTANARFWLSGAKLAERAGDPKKAKKRYRMAEAAVPKRISYLSKKIYESHALNNFYRGDWIDMREIAKEARSQVADASPSGKLKLELLVRLSNYRKRDRVARDFLKRKKLSSRVQGDLDMIKLLGHEALRTGGADQYLEFVKRAHAVFAKQYQSTSPIIKQIQEWRIRTLIALGRYEMAQRNLKAYEKKFKADYISNHLNGVVLLFMDSKSKQFANAALKYFRRSLEAKPNWEGLYGMGICLIRSKQERLALEIVKQMERVATTDRKRFWFEMLRTEWYMETGKLGEAKKSLDKWLRQDTDFRTPAELLKRYAKIKKDSKLENRARQILDEFNAKYNYPKTQEGVTSPIGLHALARRPL